MKYLNNVIEADHGTLKQLIGPVRGFKTLKTAYATSKGQAGLFSFEAVSSARPGSSSAR